MICCMVSIGGARIRLKLLAKIENRRKIQLLVLLWKLHQILIVAGVSRNQWRIQSFVTGNEQYYEEGIIDVSKEGFLLMMM